eukprot:gene3769-4291_t
MSESERSNCIEIKDNYERYSLNHFCIPKHYEDDLQNIMIPRGLVLDRVERVARDIHREFKSGPIVALCVLKGGYQFFKDLLQHIKDLNANAGHSVQLGIDFIRAKSYVNEKSSGEIEIIGNDDFSGLKGKHVLIVEDIIETGNTMKKLVELISQYNPASIKVASLLIKRTGKPCAYKPDFVGFNIPDEFVVGYALDYNEYFRDLDHICVVSNEGVKKYQM